MGLFRRNTFRLLCKLFIYITDDVHRSNLVMYDYDCLRVRLRADSLASALHPVWQAVTSLNIAYLLHRFSRL